MNIYPLVPDTSKLLLQCTATMLEACGYATDVAVHPSVTTNGYVISVPSGLDPYFVTERY